MPLHLDDERTRQLVTDLQGFWLTEFDEELSDFRAAQVVQFVLGSAGPQVYNQAVQDARAFVQAKLDDLDGEIYWTPERGA